MDTKRGAPKKTPSERKANVVQIRLTDAEKTQCEFTANAENLKMSAWARGVLVKAAARGSRKNS